MKYLMDFLTFFPVKGRQVPNCDSRFGHVVQQVHGGPVWQGRSFVIRFIQNMPATENTLHTVLQSVRASASLSGSRVSRSSSHYNDVVVASSILYRLRACGPVTLPVA